MDAARLYRDPASIYINRGEFHSERPGFARIGTRGRDFSKRFGSSFQYNVSLDRNVLRNLCLEASAGTVCELMRLTVFTVSVVPAGIVAAFKVEAAKHAQTVTITVMNFRIILV